MRTANPNPGNPNVYNADQMNNAVGGQLREAFNPESHHTARLDAGICALRAIDTFAQLQQPPIDTTTAAQHLTPRNRVLISAMIEQTHLASFGTKYAAIRETAMAVRSAVQPNEKPQDSYSQLIAN